MQKSTGTVEFDLRNQYKSLDDVSLNSICSDNKWNTKLSHSIASTINMSKMSNAEKTNCDERKWNNVSKQQQQQLLQQQQQQQQCDKSLTRSKNWLIMKKDLQCDKCGSMKTICNDGTIVDNRCSRGTATCHLSDEYVSNGYYFDGATFKSTNCKHKSESTHSLGGGGGGGGGVGGCGFGGSGTGRSSIIGSTHDIHLTIRRRIVYAQVLLEAFGNATSAINSNSSRFVSSPQYI